MEELPIVKVPPSLNKNGTVENIRTEAFKDLSKNSISNSISSPLNSESAINDTTEVNINIRGVQSKRGSFFGYHNSDSSSFDQLSSKQPNRYHANAITTLPDKIDRIKTEKARGNSFAFHELNYNRKKGMENLDLQVITSKRNQNISSNLSYADRQNVLFLEDEDCFRVMKPKLFTKYNDNMSPNMYESKSIKFQNHNRETNIQRSRRNGLKYDNEGRSLSSTLNNKIAFFDVNNDINPQSNNDIKKLDVENERPQIQSDNKYFALKNKTINANFSSTENRNSPETFYLAYKTAPNHQNKSNITEWSLNNEHNLNQDNKLMETDNSSSDPKDDLINVSRGIPNKLHHKNLDTQDKDLKIHSQKKNKSSETVDIELTNLFKMQNIVSLNKSSKRNQLHLKYPENKQGEQGIIEGDRENISKPTNDKKCLEGDEIHTDKYKRNNNFRSEQFRIGKEKYDSKTNSYDAHYKCRSNAIINQLDRGLCKEDEYINLKNVGNKVEPSYDCCINYPPYYSQYFLPQMYQSWLESYLGYTNPSINILDYQNYWWSAMQPSLGTPSGSTAEGNDIDNVPLPQPQPYTGIAGYNWPTTRKSLASTEQKEENDYPVYVKPPIIGNEETEQLRNAFLKYVRYLRFKLYKRSVRKQKQMKRRERNCKKRIASKLAKPDEFEAQIAEPEKGDSLSNDLIHCQENSVSGKILPYVPDSVENIDEEIKPLLEIEPRLLNGSLSLETDTFEFSERDFLQKGSSHNSNKAVNNLRRKMQDPPHPIFGPVCSWKEAFLDEYLTCNVPEGLDK